MTTAVGDSRKTTIVLILVFIFISANSILAANEIFYLNLLPVVIFVAALAFVRLDLYYYLIIALTPLSIQLIEFIPGSPVDFAIPTEPLQAVLIKAFSRIRFHWPYYSICSGCFSHLSQARILLFQ